ncbi:MAG: ABC transporter permease [Vicinamibacterales bacterium]
MEEHHVVTDRAAAPGVRDFDYDSARRLSPLAHELVEVWRYRDLVQQLTARNIKVRYQHSLLGVGWTVLSPLLTTAVLSIVFMTLFRQVEPHYPAYLLSGLLLWNFFVQTTSTMATEMIGGADLWKRIYTPKTVFALATLATGLVHLLLALVSLVALMLILGVPLGLASPFALVPMLAVALFALGVGLLLAACATRFRDVIDLYQVASVAWLYLTPVIYPRAIVPDRYQWLLTLNPMTWFIEAFRVPMLQNSLPSPATIGLTTTLAIGTAVLGCWVFTHVTDGLATRA